MSALGQKQTFENSVGMSAKCQKRTSGSFKNNKLDFAESADKAPSRKSRTHSSHLGEARVFLCILCNYKRIGRHLSCGSLQDNSSRKN